MKEISDLGLMAGLLIMGFVPISSRKEGTRIIFTFQGRTDEEQKQLEQSMEDFYNHRMLVDAFSYHMALKQVKTSIIQMSK